MNDLPHRPETADEAPRELEKRLLPELRAEAANAAVEQKDLYRWLTDTAATLPSHLRRRL